MPRLSQRITQPLVVLLFLLGCFLAALIVFQYPSRPNFTLAAVVKDQPITLPDFEAAIRDHLWRHNQSWPEHSPESRRQIRSQVLESLVNDRLIRSFRLADLAPASLPKTASKREADMHQRQFVDLADLSRRLAAQHLSSKAFDAEIEQRLLDEAWITRQIQPRLRAVTRSESIAWYDRHKESLRIPRAFHAAHLFLTRHDSAKKDRESEIRQIYRQLLAKEKTFAQLTAQYSEDDRTKALGGDLGWFTHQRMPADFIAALSNLQPGQISSPVQTRLGWHIILLLERHESRLPSFEEAQSEITAHLTTSQREDAVRLLLADLRQSADTPTPSVIYDAAVIDRAIPAP
ncbi:peptidylprolyl isomerase [Prosthecobacter sp.]|uniref:peptidylprolyl isomerase n=1 Tax=Prosthecobacter sp. TaxID=1965333 RepID=UPI00378315A2